MAAVYPESLDSSPRSRQNDSWDTDRSDPLPPPQKLRFMCSYGGHIVPRPHDKTLCYIGGDTRIIVIDRHTSLADLRQRLSKTLLHNQPFTLKYQLPNEDLDSLISVSSDEDLENMEEEYDRLNNPSAGLKNGRLRLFLFPQTSSSSIEQLLVETSSTKSEDWFFNALNGKASTLSAGASDRGFSESSSVNCLLGLDDDLVGKAVVGPKNVEAQIEGSKSCGNVNVNVSNQDVNSVPDSPVLETTSSFGSTSSSPSVANLPPIRVHVEENPKVGIEDQFQQMNLGVVGNVNLVAAHKPEEAGGLAAAAGQVVSGVPVVVGGEYPNLTRVISDDERSDHGGCRKVQQVQQQVQPQLPIPQFQQRQATTFDLASPDSVSSEGSMTNPLSRQRQAMYQDSILQLQSVNTKVAANQPDPKPVDQNNTKIEMQPQVQESSTYVLSSQYEQNQTRLHHPQQFLHAGNHQYIRSGPVPMASYYPIYTPQQQNNPHQPTMDQQYPFYFVQARPAPGYNIPMQQTNYNELAPNAPSGRPQTPPSKPEIVYQTAIGSGQQLIQPQYVGFTQIHHPSQSVAPSSATNTTYAYEFTDPNHAQMYYNQALPPQLAAHYQTLTSAPALVDASGQVPLENIKQQQRNLQQ
ncbi:Octicosapeptide/Phox/Bem1p family protein [Striga hermonthica]|uniref:Octicosapeptide/Phox/Bem1p family protein n=1 Tax=Striga hermonthica TaxID=68872 RepID=A0A9N7MXD0_STRHE|nr:Octicosapeptide/Phox/Bem1p family protein [Striga hermonthica]